MGGCMMGLQEPITLDHRVIMEFASLVADMVLAKQEPVQDSISQRKAEELYGRTWLKYHLERGDIRARRQGQAKNSPITYSRSELRAIYVAECQLTCRIKTRFENEKKK